MKDKSVDEVLCKLCWAKNVSNATDSYLDCYFNIKKITSECDKLQQAKQQLGEVIKECIEKTKERTGYYYCGMQELQDIGFDLEAK